MLKIKVLYVNHAAAFGGASRSLLEMLRAFPKESVQPYVLTRKGQFQYLLKDAGIDVIGCGGIAQFDNTRYSHYRGIRWLVLFREIVYLPTTFFGLLAAKWRWGAVDIVHVNEITLMPVIWLAKMLFACPVVVHVRSVQHPQTDLRGKILKWLIKTNVNQFIAIDETVKSSIDKNLNVVVIHNGLDVSDNPPTFRGKANHKFTVGMVGTFAKAKGCLEFIEAAKICRDQGVDVHFVLTGQSVRKPSVFRDTLLRFAGISQESHEAMKALVTDYGLDSLVEFRPFTTQLEEVYGILDVICFPSHFDAPGRPIFEAALFGIPSIAAISQPLPDTIIEGKTGLIIPPYSASELAKAIIQMYNFPERRFAMGKHAKELAEKNFNIKKNTLEILSIYRALFKAQK